MSKALGVIPARGGSKRIPRKNIKPLCGQPLIAWTIRAAQQATKLTDWLVSTDDEEIADTCRSYGAPVLMRPDELATDEVRNGEVLIHALELSERWNKVRYDIVLLLQPTCPIRDPKHIDQAIDLLAESTLETLASVRGPIEKRDPNIKALRNGILEPYGTGSAYIYNASIYGMKRDFLLRERKFAADVSVPLVMDKLHSVDIDDAFDFAVAEAAMQHREREND